MNFSSYNPFIAVDQYISNLFFIFRDEKLIKFFLWITLFGKWEVVSIFFISVVLILWLWGKRQYSIALWASIAGSEFFVFLIKIIFGRFRPQSAFYIEQSFSFPSGHASIAVVLYGFLIYMILKNIKNVAKKKAILNAGILVILLIGFSRLYLGVHYFSDVIFGYLNGILWLALGVKFYKYLFEKNKFKDSHFISKNRKTTTILIIASAIFAYIIFVFFYNQILYK
ncbi:MAG: phosphatase PAP2 family protein [Candidatus Gracilibacteria bacterium]|jgi:undecaprenyl-diphosphatase